MIVVGIGGSSPRVKEPVVPYACAHCEQDVRLHHVVTRRWFTLFLLPVVPLRRRHWLACPECRYGFRLDRHMRGLARRMAELTSEFDAGGVAPEDYERIVRAYLASRFVSLSPLQPAITKTCAWCGADVAAPEGRCPACGQTCDAWEPVCGVWSARDQEGRVFASPDGVDWERVRADERCPACGLAMRASERSCTGCGTTSRPEFASA
jgi:hypothetical protein